MYNIKKNAKKLIFRTLPSSTALMFHHIDDGNIIPKSGCRLQKETFLDIIDSKIPFIPMEEYVKFRFSRKNPCTITFDDGLKDVYRVAYPELKKRNIPFTVFVITDFLGTEGYITEEELITMASDPLVTIGSHGITHDIMKGMDVEQQKHELIRSKELLQKLIGREIRYFAYSHGQYDEKTLEILRKEKCYDFAFDAGGGVTNCLTKRDLYTLPRMNCEDGFDAFRIITKFNSQRLIQIN